MRFVFFLFLVLFPLLSSAQGLYIRGNEAIIEKRSSYTVFDRENPVFNDKLHIEFQIMSKISSRGIIMRMKNNEAKRVYCLSFNGEGQFADFKLNIEGKETLILHQLDKKLLNDKQWLKITLDFDLRSDSVTFQIGDHSERIHLNLQTKYWQPEIYFGRSEHVIDVPSFRISKLQVNDNEKKFYFPLDESEGEYVHNYNKKIVGQVTNPGWLINESYFWNSGPSFSSSKVAGSAFNHLTQEVYYFNVDSINIYNTRTRTLNSFEYTNSCPMSMRLGTNFLDTRTNSLYIYEVADPLDGDLVMARLDLSTMTWEAITNQVLPIQLHHHAGYLDVDNRKYTIFGGFGRTFYSDDFFTFDLETNRWEEKVVTGDKITPRYFSSAGVAPSGDELFIFGGMGNEAGDQTIGRMYYYELFNLNLKNNKLKKYWTIPWNGENVVPARNLIFVDNENFYALCYPEHFSQSFLKLYKFSVADSSFQIFGDSIPVISDKITTNVNLFHDSRSSQLITLVQEFRNDDVASTMKIYTLSFPPVTKEALMVYEASYRVNMLKIAGIVIALLVICLLILWLYRKKKSRTAKSCHPENKIADNVTPELLAKRPNSVFLFGDLSIIDKSGREINYMMSAKLKQAFFLILFYSLQDKKLTSQELSEYLWPNKSYDKAKNSRGVVLNNLRKILGELDGINLIHENGNYKFVYAESCYCDYLRCLEITESNNENEMDEFLTIISRGKFMKGEEVSELDSVKEYFESRVESTSYFFIDKAMAAGNYEAVITLCENIFMFDPLDENALHNLIRAMLKLDLKNEARQRYYLFVVEYKKLFGEDYSKSFAELSR